MPTKSKSAPPKPKPEESSEIGQRLIAGMEELLAVARKGGMKAVEKTFKVRKVKRVRFEKPALGKTEVVAIRGQLGVSQPVFAELLGVSPGTVRAWEQGVNVPSGIALRFLAEIRENPEYWTGRLKAVAVG
jgi:putative transcriptional regulator